MSKYDATIKDLKAQRDYIKKSYEPSMKGKKFMGVMEQMLKLKLDFKKNGGGNNVLKGKTHHMKNMDVLVMNED